MNDRDYTTVIAVDQTPEETFAAVINVRGWWSEDIEGRTDRVGEEFEYRFRDIHRCRMRITESIPGRRVMWRVLDNYFNFTDDKSEWKGTDIVFEIAQENGRTELRFTHQGLVPEYECYEACSAGWRTYINGSLRALIATGKGQPNVGQPMNENERALAREAG